MTGGGGAAAGRAGATGVAEPALSDAPGENDVAVMSSASETTWCIVGRSTERPAAPAAAAGAAVVSGNGGPAKNEPPPPQRARRDRGKNDADVGRLLDVTVHRARTNTERQRRAGLVERATSHTSPIGTYALRRTSKVTTDGLISSKTGRLFIGC